VELQLQLHLYKVILEDQLQQRHNQVQMVPAVVVLAETDLVLPPVVPAVLVGIQSCHHLPMEHLDHLLQLHNIDTLLVEVVEVPLEVVDLAVVVAVVFPQEIRGLQTLVVVEEEVRPPVELVVLALLLFNIQNKEVKLYGTLCTNRL
jgi:hypothetical protein